ncbi:winged helix-turn-helix domain-containing protein [Aquincola sp. S2]|uniref:Winged helix-turn-helix domain-containing protein n=1 Tax=Pseudaquabacterium terrae TaxID=2732868 RepID=A0ABX2EUQ0_9BURK|nr:winged helix-turn-helix domain-containing protein [Aquabacterium terrae]NRF72403.1 winged helix-turn-helix domain-containing protein [Aquabacterium terrae]
MSDRWRSGRFELRPVERQLIVDGTPAALGARAFDLLLALHEHRDRTVPKSELMDTVWPGLVVEENNLQVQVSALRKLLGPQAIATIPGRGYRFALAADAEQPPRERSTAPRSTSAQASLAALPGSPECLFGRDDDLAALARLLSEHRLVTVLGAGGIGKTTLALAAARGQALHCAKVAWVELAPLADPLLIPGTIAQVLQLPIGAGDPVAALVRSIEPLHVLLVLDNAEHLVAAVAGLAEALLAGAPGVRLLVTSQAPLKVEGEWLFRVGPLAVPEAGTPFDQALGYGAVALFDERARAADRRFVLGADNVDLVIDLCRRLDGLALAIRLAASRVAQFGLAELHARLAEPLKLLAGGSRSGPTRQQTLRATHDWSHRLLAPVEQVVFRRLGVFAGDFTLASAAAVAGDETHDEWSVIEALATLVDRSLVVLDEREDPRYRLLQSARDYALERLDESGEAQALRTRHGARMLRLMEQSLDDETSGMPDREWLARYGCELDDLRAAIDWSKAHDPAMAVALVGASLNLFTMLGLLQAARAHSDELEHQVVEATPALAAARFWSLRSLVVQVVSRQASEDAALKAVECFRSSGHRLGLHRALAFVVSTTLLPAEKKHEMVQEMQDIERLEERSPVRAHRLAATALLAMDESRFEDAHALLVSAVDLVRAAGRDRQCASFLVWLSFADDEVGAAEAAVAHCREAVALYRAGGASNVERGLRSLVRSLLNVGDVCEARLALADLIERKRRSSWNFFLPMPALFAMLAALEGRFDAAAKLLGLSERLFLATPTNDNWSERTHVRIRAMLTDALAPADLQRWMTQGAELDEPAACGLALERPKP